MLSRKRCVQWWGNGWGEDSKVSCAQLFTLNHHTLCSTSFSPSSMDQTVTCMNLMGNNCVCKHNTVISDYPFPKGIILHQENLIQFLGFLLILPLMRGFLKYMFPFLIPYQNGLKNWKTRSFILSWNYLPLLMLLFAEAFGRATQSHHGLFYALDVSDDYIHHTCSTFYLSRAFSCE